MRDTKKRAGQTANKTAKPKAAKPKAAAPKKAVATTAAPELMMACEVIGAQDNGGPLKIGAMICGRGARIVQPKSNADKLANLGWVNILGIA